MCLQFHSVKEPSKNRDIWVWVLFGSLWGRFGSVRVLVHFYFGFGFCSVFGKTWGSVLSCWVHVLSHLYFQGDSTSSELTRIDRVLMIDFLLMFRSNYGFNLYLFQDIARYWPKMLFFFQPPRVFNDPSQGISFGIV